MFDFLRALGLRPLEWSQAVEMTASAAPFVGEVLTAAFEAAQAVVVLMTPDDLAHLRPHLLQDDDPAYEKEPTPSRDLMSYSRLAWLWASIRIEP